MILAFSWPIASIFIAGFVCIAVVLVVLFDSDSSTSDSRTTTELLESQHWVAEQLAQLTTDIASLREQVDDLQRVLKQVE